MSTLTCRMLGTGDPISISAEFSFDPADPMCVLAEFHNPDGSVTPWAIGRELLDEGMTGGTPGIGDVRVWPGHGPTNRTFLRFISPEGEALIEAPTDMLAAFLRQTYDEVPAGTESDVYAAAMTNDALAAWISA